MVRGRARIDSLEAGRDALAEGPDGERPDLVVPVADAVPPWVAALVADAGEAGRQVLVEAEPPADLAGEALDGWEIGLCTMALAGGAAGILGIDPQRVARVREVHEMLGAGAPQPTQEPAS